MAAVDAVDAVALAPRESWSSGDSTHYSQNELCLPQLFSLNILGPQSVASHRRNGLNRRSTQRRNDGAMIDSCCMLLYAAVCCCRLRINGRNRRRIPGRSFSVRRKSDKTLEGVLGWAMRPPFLQTTHVLVHSPSRSYPSAWYDGTAPRAERG